MQRIIFDIYHYPAYFSQKHSFCPPNQLREYFSFLLSRISINPNNGPSE